MSNFSTQEAETGLQTSLRPACSIQMVRRAAWSRTVLNTHTNVSSKRYISTAMIRLIFRLKPQKKLHFVRNFLVIYSLL